MKKGIPVPCLRDPKTSQPSVSFTMVAVSFGLCVVGLVGKWAKQLDGINMSEALQLFGLCATLYFGRKQQEKTAEQVPQAPSQ